MTSSIIMYRYTINTGVMKKVFIYIAIVTTVLLNACTEDPKIAGPNKEKMKRVIASAASQPFVEANEVTRGTHRAMPAGYSVYSALDNPSIGLILTRYYTVSSNLIYVASESRWEGNLDIADDKQYYIYGFMPSNTTAKNYISAYADYRDGSESFADGAKMTVKNLKTGAKMVFTLVGESEANLAQGKLAASTPIGKALLGRRKGETVDVNAPAGIIKFEILDISL